MMDLLNKKCYSENTAVNFYALFNFILLLLISPCYSFRLYPSLRCK